MEKDREEDWAVHTGRTKTPTLLPKLIIEMYTKVDLISCLYDEAIDRTSIRSWPFEFLGHAIAAVMDLKTTDGHYIRVTDLKRKMLCRN